MVTYYSLVPSLVFNILLLVPSLLVAITLL